MKLAVPTQTTNIKMAPLNLSANAQINHLFRKVQRLDDEIKMLVEFKKTLNHQKDMDFWDLSEFADYSHLLPDSPSYKFMAYNKRKLEESHGYKEKEITKLQTLLDVKKEEMSELQFEINTLKNPEIQH